MSQSVEQLITERKLPVQERARRVAAAVVEELRKTCRFYLEAGEPFVYLPAEDRLVLISPKNHSYRQLIYSVGVQPRCEPEVWERVLVEITKEAYDQDADRRRNGR